MELRHLRYFVAIAEEHSFTRAAERLWTAQPGPSAQIRGLRTAPGLRLFARDTAPPRALRATHTGGRPRRGGRGLPGARACAARGARRPPGHWARPRGR